jgi:predicted RecB family nuclease
MFSPTRIANFLACHHLTQLERVEDQGELKRPFFFDIGRDLLRKLGERHEQAHLHLLEERGLNIVSIPWKISREEAAKRTVEALQQGADAVYQPALIHEHWYGRADFLRRVEMPSELGAWSYEVIETKLARSTKVRALIQLCFYSDLLSKIQGVAPEFVHVVLGGGVKPETFPLRHYIAYFRKIKREFEQAYQNGEHTYPEPVEHCDVCDWFPLCDERRRADDHLSLVARIGRNQRKALVERGINTLTHLGRLSLPVKPKFERIGDQALMTIREQARLQLQGREEGKYIYELLQPPEPERGLCALPVPSPGDMFLDFEGSGYAFDQGLEYLTGVVTLPDNPEHEPIYTSLWALEPTAEKAAFEKFISTVMERWRRYPDMHIYHYASYEETAIKRMAGTHATRIEEVDQLLRAGVLVDLHRVVRQGLRASVESYSIKKLEPLYGYTRDVRLRDATVALQTFDTILALGAGDEDVEEVSKVVEEYNRDDCISTLLLRNWLESLRVELESLTGTELPRPAPQTGEPTEDLSAQLERVYAVFSHLMAGVAEDESQRNDEQRARWLLAQLLEWHRREDKSAWWEHFRLRELTDEELQEDRNALGGLSYVGPVGEVKHSIIHRYQFPPQEHGLDEDTKVRDPKTGASPGQIVAIDDRNRTIDLKRGAASTVPHPAALIPFNIVETKWQKESLLRLGSWVAGNGIDSSGNYRAARDLLLRCVPRLRENTLENLEAGETDALELAKSAVLLLDHSSLPIQGPPGSGKTYTGARMILELVKSHRVVGITAVSHQVISNLLKEVCDAAREVGMTIRALQKTNEEDGCDDEMVTATDSNQDVVEALENREVDVVAGTTWLWSRDELGDSIDVLFIDEAGQMSLANALAAAQAAKNLVMLGDPQQLDQPRKGVHPPGAEASVLAHILNRQATIDDRQGLFLSETFRLHPDICAFTSEQFYDARLRSRPANVAQRLNAQEFLDGTGLRFVPICHQGNQNESSEEVEAVAKLVTQLINSHATWTNERGDTTSLSLGDILIVAPYNAQVSALAERLPKGARVGTVDKFQGKQAPVVFYSMASSTPEDAPRGMEFLYSRNRLNVATSRAKCVTVLVASPALFDVQCRTPRQMELANAFCRYLEMAKILRMTSTLPVSGH